MQKKWIRPVLAVMAVPVVAVGVYHMVRAYEAGTMFQPGASGRELQVNQVVFSGEEDTTAQKNGEEQNGESELWEKDKNAEDNLSPQVRNTADYLFQTGRTSLPENSETIRLAEEEADHRSRQPEERADDGDNRGYIYDVTDKAENADSTITTDGEQENGQNGENTGNITGDGQGEVTPSPSARPGDMRPAATPVPTPRPTVRPADTARDPESEKNNSSLTKPHPYDEKEVGDTENVTNVTITQSTEGVQLYKGQKIEARTVYNALITQIKTKDGNFYNWGKDHYDRYLRITGVSFDNGNTWLELPTEIPTDLAENSMLIRTEYRFSEGTDTWTEKVIPYLPKDSRIFVLSEKLTEADQVIPAEKIINTEYINQYKEADSRLNLLSLQSRLLGNDSLQALFPGWTENGEIVPWFYEITPGRHILEPEDMVPLDDRYTVKLEMVWLTDDYRQEGNLGSNLCYLQTLTDVEERKPQLFQRMLRLFRQEENETLTVPEYVQAVDIDEDAGLSVDYLAVPDSVILIEASDGLQVKKGYEVDAENPYYCSGEDGVLMDTEETTIYAVPYECGELTIPANIRKVRLTAQNQLRSIRLEQTQIQDLPQIDLNLLRDCNVIVPDELLETYLLDHRTQITQEKGLSVSAASDPALEYSVSEDTIQNSDGEICRLFPGEKDALVIPGGTTGIRSGVFDGNRNIKTLYFPEDGKTIRLEKGCFTGGGVETIYCYSSEQYESTLKQLEQAGDSGIQVELLNISREGFYYQAEEKDGRQINVLVRTPRDITEYDGTVTDKEGNPVRITRIGDNAFENCESLKWVSLPEETDTIGDRAFKNCHALQGIFIAATESITIGEYSLDGCEQLRFLGSNARKGILVNDYYPEDAKDLLAYVPTDCQGYNSHYTCFTEESGVYGYSIVTTGAEDKMLYGTNEKGEPWLLLRSGQNVGEQMELPKTTREIFQDAMAGVESTGEYFTVNWTELPDLFAVDARAFQGSALGGTVEFPQDYYQIDDSAFAQCTKITEAALTGMADSLGRNLFYGCTGLRKVTIGPLGYAGIYGGIFSGCDNLTDIYFTSWMPAALLLEGSYYRFNYEWTAVADPADEVEHLQIHVPEGCEQSYIDSWKYLYAGYYDITGEPMYLQMWNSIQSKHTEIDWDSWEWIYPSDEEVDAWLEEELLTSENGLRHMMGMNDLQEPSNFYNYREKDGFLTLFRTPYDSSSVMLDGTWIGLPNGWYLDYIETGTFSRSIALENVFIPGNLVGIYSDAFAGAKLANGTLTLYLEGNEPPALLRTAEDEPFTFGVADECMALAASPFSFGEIDEDDYVEAWAPALATDNTAEALETAKQRLYRMFAAGRGEDYEIITEKLPSISGGDAGITVSGGDAANANTSLTEADRTQEETE